MFGGAGRRKKEESLSAAMIPENAPSSSGKSSVTGFDPEGLERAAKAARDLDNSRNAAAAIELIKTQEATKQVPQVLDVVHFVVCGRNIPIHLQLHCSRLNSTKQLPREQKWMPTRNRCEHKTLKRKPQRLARRSTHKHSTSDTVPSIKTNWSENAKLICSRLKSTCKSELDESLMHLDDSYMCSPS